MGNPNTEAKKAKKRKVRAKEIQKTRLYQRHGWDNLTPYSPEEALLSSTLPRRRTKRDRRCYFYMDKPFNYTTCPGCGRTREQLHSEGHGYLWISG